MDYQDKNSKYFDANAYDKRGKFSVFEKYVLDLWRPFLADKIKNKMADGKIIDLGCGTGEYAQFLSKNNSIVCFDDSEAMLERAKNKLLDLGFYNVIFKAGSV